MELLAYERPKCCLFPVLLLLWFFAMTTAIDFLMDEPEGKPLATFVFAHGAGAAMDTPFMHYIARGLAAGGVQVLRFEFPYMAQRRHGGSKRPPNPQSQLLDCWRQVLDEAPVVGPLFVGGKSMGGRMASLLVDELYAASLDARKKLR